MGAGPRESASGRRDGALVNLERVEKIAEAAGMPVETLTELYRELPWEDIKIAERLHTTVLYVTRLRSMARKRLGQAIPFREGRGPHG